MKKILSLLCIAVLLMGMTTVVAASPAVYDEIGEDPYVSGTHDVSAMSFNVLAFNSSPSGASADTGTYASEKDRYYRVLTIIEEYAPDVIGIQEAANNRNVDTRPWDTALKQDLAKLGYGGVCITEENNKPTRIGSGMMIFYKTERFAFDKSKQDHGWLDLRQNATLNGVTATHNQERYLQWLELIDKEHNDQSLYIFNTHLAIDVTKDTSGNTLTDSALIKKLSNAIRTKQAAAIAAKIKEKAENTPFMAMGDYNCSLAGSYDKANDYLTPLEEGYNQLAAMPAVMPSIADAMLTARQTVTADIYGLIDHVFYNRTCQTVREALMITDSVDGRRPSDHNVVMAYTSYRAELSVAPEGYDHWMGEIRQQVTGNSTTLALTPADADYTVMLPSLELPRYHNEFDINVYYQGKLFDTLRAVITRTDAPLPAITASGAENCYFVDGEFRVAVAQSTDAVTLSGALYSDADCSKAVSGELQGIAGGVTRYYTKQTATGEIFPVLICKETASAAADTLYLDDMPASGIGAFVKGNEVILVEKGVNGVATLDEAVTLTNTASVDTLRIAAGRYGENTVSFKENISILGPNAEIEAMLRVREGHWSLNPAREEEAVIEGGIYFSGASDVTVRGLSFEGRTKQGSITLYDDRDYTQSTHLCIENNIFMGSASFSNGAAVYFNTPVQKSGSVKGNAFFCTANRVDYADADNTHFYRGLFGRNINGLTVEENFFSGIITPMWLDGEVQDRNITNHGYCAFTVKNNRFAYCGTPMNGIRNIGGNTNARVIYSGNDFIRCNKNSYALTLNINETALDMDPSKIFIEISDNRFFGCDVSLAISGTLRQADITKATVRVLRNRFIYTNEGYYQLDKLSKTVRLDLNAPDKQSVVLPADTTWDFSHNYFLSAYLVKGNSYSQGSYDCTVPDVNDPKYFVYNKNSGGVAAVTNALDLFAPYYSDYAMTTLVGEHRWESDYTVDVAPTCIHSGTRSIHCASCTATKEAQVVPATGIHTPAGNWIAEENGHYYRCATEGCTVRLNLSEHTAGEWRTVLQPTAAATGLREQRCTACDLLMNTEVLPATGVALVEGQPYASLQEALLAAAEKAAKVVLVTNVVVDELVLQPGVTLDLNGHTLSAEYVIGFKGSAIGGEGKLMVDPSKVTLDQTNGAFLPVFEKGGYIFINVKLENRIALQGEKEFVFSPLFDADAHEALLEGSAISGVKVIVRLKWEKEENYKAVQDFKYLDDKVEIVINSYDEKALHYGEMFVASFAGSEASKDEGVQISAVILSDTGVEIASEFLS